MNSQTQEKVGQIQLLEQNMQQILAQKHAYQTQLFETETAIAEIAKTTKPYKIIGNIMVESDKEELKKELEQKKSIIEIRMQTIEKQENQIKERTKKIQEEVMKELK